MYNEQNTSQKQPNRKKRVFIIAGIIILLILISPLIIYGVFINRVQIVSGSRGELRFDTDSQSPNALNIYRNMYENMTLSDLDALIEKSGYVFRKDIDEIDEDVIYLTNITAIRKESVCRYDDGYVKYRIDRQEGLTEEQEPNKWAVDIEYHECVKGKDLYIIEMLDGKYRSFTGSATIDYDTKEDAILNLRNIRVE